MKKNNLLIIFDHQLGFRSYKETNILDDLSDYYDTKICIIGNNPKNITSDPDSKNTLIQLKPFESFFLAIYANAYWCKVAKNSLSIQNRTWHEEPPMLKKFSAKLFGRWYFKFCRKTPLLLTQIFLYRVLRIINLVIGNHSKIKVLYITTGGTNSLSDLLVKSFARKKIEILTIVENWDNMSSKAVFNYPPLRIGVWGYQSIKFGTIIHNLDSNRMVPIGNPRVEWLRNNISPGEFRRNIFFGGGSVDLNSEMSFLDVAIRKAESLNIKIYYLPHPKFYDTYLAKLSQPISHSLVILGKRENQLGKDMSLPELTDYLVPFQEAKIFISTLSTLNLEASLLGIPSIAIDLKTKINLRKNFVSDRHDHIKDIKDDDLFYFVQDLNTFENLLSNLMEVSESFPMTDKRLGTLNYLVNNAGEYFKKLLNFIE